jgi:transposase
LDWRAKVELFEEIRREYEFGLGTVAGVAKRLGVHRRMVREAIASAMPKPRKKPEERPGKLKPFYPVIDRMLEEDRTAPRKQRHTARRIWDRLRESNPGFAVGERSVRAYVSRRKEELGLAKLEIFVPQLYAWGVEAQVDFYESWAELGGERVKLHVFTMRSMGSGGAFHRAYLRPTQQAFLEGHELAFRYFGGVFQRLRYDNLTAAVKKIVRGYRREETARFIAFRSHWRFASEFCTPAEAHEKGGVEGEAGYFRRNHWVPVPRCKDLDELNASLLADCIGDQQRQIAGKELPVGSGMVVEKDHLLPLAEEGFDLAERSFPSVDGFGCVRVRTNRYSVPRKPGTRVEARVHSNHVEIWHEGSCIAKHERHYGHQQQVLDLEHYLDVLERKPGALAGSKPLAAWREKGMWPACFDRLWAELNRRHGNQNGTRFMIGLLQLGRRHGNDRLRQAIESALAAGCTDVSAIEYLLNSQFEAAAPEPLADVGLLIQYERPLPTMAEYDRLLYAGGAQ